MGNVRAPQEAHGKNPPTFNYIFSWKLLHLFRFFHLPSLKLLYSNEIVRTTSLLYPRHLYFPPHIPRFVQFVLLTQKFTQYNTCFRWLCLTQEYRLPNNFLILHQTRVPGTVFELPSSAILLFYPLFRHCFSALISIIHFKLILLLFPLLSKSHSICLRIQFYSCLSSSI